MPATYEPIATTTLSSAASSITFSSIPGTYTDLRLVIVAATTNTGADGWGLFMQFNSDTGSNYSRTMVEGNGSSAISARATSVTSISVGFTLPGTSTSLWGFGEIDIFSYAGSTNKTCLMTSSSDLNGSGWVRKSVGLWRNTNAITTVGFTVEGGNNFRSGTSATLYGILKA